MHFMKIILVAPSFYPATYYGGPIFSSYELAKALRRRNIDISVITTNANGNEKLKIKKGKIIYLDENLPVKYYSALNSKGTSVSMLCKLWAEIKATDVVYLVSVFSFTTPFTLLLCKLLNRPIIIAPKGQIDKWCMDQGSKFKKLWMKFFIKPCINHIHWHTTSEDEQKYIRILFPSSNTFVIKHGVNMETLDFRISKQRKHFNKYTNFDCSKKKIIISMGRIHKKKGFDILIEAISKVLKVTKDKGKSEDIVLLIAGEDFGERKKLEILIDKLELNEKVFFVGHVEGDEKKYFLQNADVFALASYDENFGIVYAEALAAGTPIVASKNTPWEDVEKFNCGKWVENTPENFSTALLEILSSDGKQMGENGYKYVADNLSWDIISKQFQDKIDSIA